MSSEKVAKAFRALAGTVLVCVPAAMVVGTRSSQLFVSAAATAIAAALVAEGRARTAWRKARALLRTPLGLSCLVFATWSAATIGWSAWRGSSGAAFGEAVLAALAGFVLSLGIKGQARYFSCRIMASSLALGLAAACALVLTDLASGMWVQRELGVRAAPFVLNRAVLTIAVFSAPVLWWLSSQSTSGPVIAITLAVLIAATALASHSGAALLGLLVGGITLLSTLYRARTTVTALALLSAIALATAPFVGDVLYAMFPKSWHPYLAGVSSEVRIEIWRAFGAIARAQPWVGLGIGASPHLATLSGVPQLPGPEKWLGIGHPHNAALQLWVETGAIGVMLAYFSLGLLLRRLSGLPSRALAPRLALIAGAGAVALVGHGAWQGWWISALGASASLFVVSTAGAGIAGSQRSVQQRQSLPDQAPCSTSP